MKGEPGWLYGKAEYIAFITKKKIIFVKRIKALNFALEKVKGKVVVYDTPKECYVPYKRKKRDDLCLKVLTSDMEELADFFILYN